MCSLLDKKGQTTDVRGQKMPKNKNVICESSIYVGGTNIIFITAYSALLS